MSNKPPLDVIVGAAGGIGAAFVARLSQTARPNTVVGVGRSRPADWPDESAHVFFEADITQDDEIAGVAKAIGELGDPVRVVVATGLLHRGDLQPEKTMRSLRADALLELFTVNAIGPALVAKHLLPRMPRDQPTIFAALSARVGSISDNRLGGWHGYRASKAALNMLIATLAIEHRRTHPQAVCVALHPGTVETALSEPFGQIGASRARLAPLAAAEALIAVMDSLGPSQSGGFFGWDGAPIPW